MIQAQACDWNRIPTLLELLDEKKRIPILLLNKPSNCTLIRAI